MSTTSSSKPKLRRKPGTLDETIDEVLTDLRKEEDVLLRLKERVMKEIKVLKVSTNMGGGG